MFPNLTNSSFNVTLELTRALYLRSLGFRWTAGYLMFIDDDPLFVTASGVTRFCFSFYLNILSCTFSSLQGLSGTVLQLQRPQHVPPVHRVPGAL